MASAMAAKRLRKEYLALQKNPVENIKAVPLETNILEWHYVITGTPGTPYEGGVYHGKLRFPPDYPMKPPSLMMITANGRFRVNQKLCLSMSDFHPETWNPMWSVSTMLTGLYSFMVENQPTLGSINTSDAEKRRLASISLASNCADPLFCRLFPEYVELHEKLEAERKALAAASSNHGEASTSANTTSAGTAGIATGDAGVADHQKLHGRQQENMEDYLRRMLDEWGIVAIGVLLVVLMFVFVSLS